MGVSVTVEGDAAVVALDWPRTRNALGPAEVKDLADAIREADRIENIAAVVLTGNAQAFCSGGDLAQLSAIASSNTEEYVADVIYTNFHDMIHALEECRNPTIAAVDGPAIGLGMDLVLACDIRLVGPHGSLAQGWGRAGLVPGTGGAYFLDRLAPGLIWHLIVSGESLTATAAQEHGLAVACEGSAVSRAVEMAHSLARLPRPARQGYVSLERPLRFPSRDYLAACARIQGGLLTSPAFQEFAQRVLSKSASVDDERRSSE